jgi:hypothetical protein
VNWWQAFLAWLLRREPAPPRGPTSANGASSFHLWWDITGPFDEVAAVIEVTEPPPVEKLYFWALQVNFGSAGGAHLGLQYHPRYPGGTAVNFGGYASGGGILDGSESQLPSALNNANTRNYVWEPHRKYRLRIFRSPTADGGVWRGEVTDLESGVATVVRDLFCEGRDLRSPVVWSEVFAKCADPSAAVRWTGFEAVTADGRTAAAARLRVNYQTSAQGGCPNTNSETDSVGVIQRTGVSRTTRQGAVLDVPR